MPELPDVEVLKKYMDSTSLHHHIKNIEVEDERVLHDNSVRRFINETVGRMFEKTSRHGKYLFIGLNNEHLIYFHFGMTGDLKYYKQEDKQPEYGRVFFRFSNDYTLAYISKRLLGEVGRLESVPGFIEERDLGMDALDISLEDFRDVIRGRRGAVKSFLMNQKRLAGIGNIYADEILFQAHIHPETDVRRLSPEKVKKLFQKMKTVLKKTIESGADPERFPKSYIIPHRTKDGKCPRCRGKIKKIKVNGRSAYYCPECQSKK